MCGEYAFEEKKQKQIGVVTVIQLSLVLGAVQS
jgi:hypothetical protein